MEEEIIEKIVYYCEHCKVYVETKRSNPHCFFCDCELIRSSYEN